MTKRSKDTNKFKYSNLKFKKRDRNCELRSRLLCFLSLFYERRQKHSITEIIIRKTIRAIEMPYSTNIIDTK